MIIIYNLIDGSEYAYTDPCSDSQKYWLDSRINALINCYMLTNDLALQIHNPEQRSKIAKKIILGKVSASIGDLCVMIR